MAITNLENSLPKVSSLHKMGFLLHMDFELQTMLFVTRKRLSSKKKKTWGEGYFSRNFKHDTSFSTVIFFNMIKPHEPMHF